jgi:hypothetical protein
MVSFMDSLKFCCPALMAFSRWAVKKPRDIGPDDNCQAAIMNMMAKPAPNPPSNWTIPRNVRLIKGFPLKFETQPVLTEPIDSRNLRLSGGRYYA